MMHDSINVRLIMLTVRKVCGNAARRQSPEIMCDVLIACRKDAHRHTSLATWQFLVTKQILTRKTN